ncbi:coiled-coil domain-containing protein 172-like [Aplochiton taeniatus]
MAAVRVEIIKCQDRINTSSKRYEDVNKELDEKAQQLLELKLQHELMEKHQVQVEKQAGELQQQQSLLRETLDKLKRGSREEQENFLREVTTFNSDFSLLGNRSAAFERETQTEIIALKTEASALNQEMELMRKNNCRLNSMEEEKRALQSELQGLELIMRDLESQLDEAKAVTETVRAECLTISQKPLTDSTCLRLKRELEKHKEGELELLRQGLSSELQFLQSKVEDNQQSSPYQGSII